MSRVLTDRAERLALWVKFGAFVFVGYDLSLHVPWHDALAIMCAVLVLLGALRDRRDDT